MSAAAAYPRTVVPAPLTRPAPSRRRDQQPFNEDHEDHEEEHPREEIEDREGLERLLELVADAQVAAERLRERGQLPGVRERDPAAREQERDDRRDHDAPKRPPAAAPERAA